MARKRITVASFRGEPAELEMPDGKVYLIRGDLPMEIIQHMADFEERGGDEQEAGDFDAWLGEGRNLIEKLVREGSPDQRDAVLPPMSPQEVVGVMGAMIGGESVGRAIAEAMNAGIGQALADRNEIEDAERATDPTQPTTTRAKPTAARRSTKRSSARSSS